MQSVPHVKPLIGLVGGIGGGKSRVAEAFGQRGGWVIVADRLGHEALEQPAIKAEIHKRWGARVMNPDGTVDRRKLGAIVFASPVERKNLEFLVFPYIETRVREEVKKADASPDARFTILDAAVMLEAGWNNVCDWIVYIHTPRAVRLQRLEQSRGWNEEELSRRELAQMSLTAKALRADVAIQNGGTIEQLNEQIDRLLSQWNLAA